MTTIGGTNPADWHDGIGLFGTGTPLATDIGVEVLRTSRDYPAVKRKLTEAGYNGEKIVVISPAGVPELGELKMGEYWQATAYRKDLIGVSVPNPA